MILGLFFPYKEDMNVSLGLECKLFPCRNSWRTSKDGRAHHLKPSAWSFVRRYEHPSIGMVTSSVAM